MCKSLHLLYNNNEIEGIILFSEIWISETDGFTPSEQF